MDVIADIRVAVEPYLRKLADFDTAEQIKDFLLAEGVLAQPGNAQSCAIAQYVKAGSGCEVHVHAEKTVFETSTTEVGEKWTVTEYQHHTLAEHSNAMSTFIENFDEGYYLELEA